MVGLESGVKDLNATGPVRDPFAAQLQPAQHCIRDDRGLVLNSAPQLRRWSDAPQRNTGSLQTQERKTSALGRAGVSQFTAYVPPTTIISRAGSQLGLIRRRS